MQRSEITDKLKEVISFALGDDFPKCEITEESTLTGDLGLNSIGMLYSVIAIEEYFDINFDDVGFNDFKTVKDVLDYVEKALEEK